MGRIFVNRESELNFLEKRWKSNEFEFIIIFGRRRIGKTELIKQFVKNKKYLYFLCDKSGTNQNIIRFKKIVSKLLNEPEIATNDLEEIFSYLVNKYKKRLVIIFDEFPYLVEKDNSIPSIFQRVIDNVLQYSKVFLILCGSSISMMEKGVLSSKSPLYGRKTGHLKLKRLPFKAYFKFYPNNSIEKNIEFFSVTGGIPFYMNVFSEEKTLFENVKQEIASKYGRLWEEVDFLLKSELREPDIYKKILEAISVGNSKTVNIANYVGIQVNKLSKYLLVLMNLEIIKREHPITEKKVKTKKTIYTIDDTFIDFYMNFIEPFKQDLEIEEYYMFEKNFKEKINLFISKKFEKLIREEIIKLIFKNFNKIGKWWGARRDNHKIRTIVEIDIVALNEHTKEALFCECKWKENVDAEKICKDLIENKIPYVNWYNDQRKEYIAIFAKSFKEKINEFEGRKVYCFDLKDIEKYIKES